MSDPIKGKVFAGVTVECPKCSNEVLSKGFEEGVTTIQEIEPSIVECSFCGAQVQVPKISARIYP